MKSEIIDKINKMGVISLSSAVGMLLTFISLPYLTKIYSVDDFGHYGLLLAIIGFISSFSTLRLEQAIYMSDDKKEKSVCSLMIVSSLILIFISSGFLCFFLDLSQIAPILLSSLTFVMYQLSYAVFLRRKNEYICAAINIFKVLTLLIPQVVLFNYIDNYTLVDSFIVQFIIVIIPFFIFYILFVSEFNVELSVMDEYSDLIKYNLPQSILSNFSNNMPYYIFSIFMPVSFIGVYSIADKFIKAPVLLLTQVYRQTLIRDYSRSNDINNQGKYAAKITRNIFFISSPLILIPWLIPSSIVDWVLGPEWIDIVDILKYLVVSYLFILSNPPVSAWLTSSYNSKVLFKYQVLELIIKFIFMFIIGSFWEGNYLLFGSIFAIALYNYMLYKETLRISNGKDC